MASTTKVTRLYDFVNGTASDADKVDAELNQLVTQENNTVDDITSLQSQITALTATTDGASGADSIGATAITSLSGTTVQAILESLRNSLKSVVDGSSGADFVAATAITDLSGATVQAILESLRDKLKDATDSQSGADFVAATAISGLTGATIQALLESLKTYIDTHKSSSDHDSRYYTETEMNAGQMDSRYYTESEIANATSTSASGAKKVGLKANYGATVQDWVTYLEAAGVFTGAATIPADGAVTPQKLSTTLYNDIYSPTYSTEAEVTQEITSLASTVLTGKLTAEVQGNTQTPYDQYTKLLMRFEGADASTTFVDATGKTVTPSGNAQIDTAQYISGSSSGLLDGTGDYLTVTNANNDLDIGTSDFCIELWVRPAAIGNTQFLVDYRQSADGDVAPVIYINSTGKVVYQTGNDARITGTTTLAINTWYHVSIARSSGVTKLFVNGGQEASSYTDANNYIAIANFVMGIRYTGVSAFNGHIDDLRISVGTPRYTSNFSPLPLQVLSTDRIAVKSVGKNVVNNAQELFEVGTLSNSDGTNSSSTTRLRTIGYVKVASNTSYKISTNASYSIAVLNIYYSDGRFSRTIAGSTFTTTDGETKVRVAFRRGDSATINLNEMQSVQLQIELGSTATSYTAYTETTAILPNELKRISSTVYDVWDANLGKYTKNCSDFVTLSGNAFTWTLNTDATGSKNIYPSSFSDMVASGSANTGLVFKHTNKVLTFGLGSTIDTVGFYTDKRPYINVADTDTGWDESWVSGTSFTGMTWANIIKAYMNGWKLTTANTNVASCVWTGIASGTTQSGSSGYNHVIANIDAGFTPYKMIYQLETPVVTNYYTNVLTAEPSGTIYILPFVSDYDFYDSGCVITNTSYPITALEYVNIVDKITGALTPVALSTCTVAAGGLTFTSTAISSEDLVDFGYSHAYLSAVPTLAYILDENLKATVVSNREDIGELDRKIEQVITQERSRLGVIPLTLGAISATTTFSLIAPITCDLVDIKLVTKDAIAANDTNYWTIEAIDKGSAGSDSNVIVSKTTKVTGGTAVAAYDAYDLGALDTTHSKLAAGDVVLLTFTKTASATAFAEAMAIITYIAGN